jgi:hypothetical protein
MRSYSCLMLLFAVAAALPAEAQERDRYLLLAATRTGTMQNEINQAAERGYRVVAASRTEGSEVVVVLERTDTSYRYRLVATTRTGTLQKELVEGAEAGYRVVPRAVTTKRPVGGVLDSMKNSRNEGELVIIMEKAPDPAPGLTYRVLATERTGTLQKEMSDTAESGFELIAIASRREHVAIFERVQ